MVGVPGRSKGCNTCRKRKIGCDQKRPECGNCIKSNRVCAGYHRTVVFRNATGPALNAHTTKASVSPDLQPGSSGDDESPSASAATKDVMPVGPYRRSVNGMDFPLFTTPPPQPHYRSGLLANFLDAYSPPDCKIAGIPSAWVHSIPFALNGGVQVFDTAVMAMCAVFVGRRSKNEQLLQESARVYTIALAEMNAALSNRVIHTRDETLAATMSLSLYETMGCIDPTGWQRHAHGMGLIVRLRGPEAHKSGMGHHLFSSFRAISLINSLVLRRRSFLASKEWRTIPWTNIRKIPVQELQDLITELPGILEDQDTLPRSAHPSLLRRCLDLKARLKAWHENFTSTCSSAPYWLEFSTLNIDPPVFPTCYQFPNIGIANTHTFYWANLIILYAAIIGLTPTSQPPIIEVDEIYDLAAQICMAMEYYVAPGKKSYGPMLTLYPLGIAAECFKRMGEGGEKSALWCRAVFGILAERGIVLGKMLESLVWEDREKIGWAKGWAGKGFWEQMEMGLVESAETEVLEKCTAEEDGGVDAI